MDDYTFVDELMHSDDFLAHYGVKGMRWGRRRGSSKNTTKSKKKKRTLADRVQKRMQKKYALDKDPKKELENVEGPSNYSRKLEGRLSKKNRVESEDYQKVKDLKKKRPSEMSNAELKSYIERMNLEQQYKSLKSKDVAPGQKFATDILREVSKELVKETIKDTTRNTIKSQIEKRR